MRTSLACLSLVALLGCPKTSGIQHVRAVAGTFAPTTIVKGAVAPAATPLVATCSTTCPPIPADFGKGVECQASQSSTSPFTIPCDTECNFASSVYGGISDDAPQPILKPGWTLCSYRCAPWPGRYTVCSAESHAYFAPLAPSGFDFLNAECLGGCEYPSP